MDARLTERLTIWHNHVGLLAKSEEICLQLEANEKPLWSSLFLEVEGKTVAEREAKAFASATWREFQLGLVAARVDLNRLKRELEVKQAAFNAEYLQAKNEGDAIQRHPRAIT